MARLTRPCGIFAGARMSSLIVYSGSAGLIFTRDALSSLLWLAMNEDSDMAANDPAPDKRIPIGPTDI